MFQKNFSNTLSTNTIQIPASKSYLQRYIALASLCNKKTIIHNINLCNDVLAVINAIKQCGASVQIKNNTLEINGIQPKNIHNTLSINIGESGLAARMLGIISSVIFQKVYLHGEGSILKRSMKSLITTLQQMNCKVKSNDWHLPLEINSPQHYPQKIIISDSDTSQIITGLLFALPLLNQNTKIEWKEPTSIPYIDISLDVLKKFGISISHNNYKYFNIQGMQKLKPINVQVEGDWSNAAFFIVLAAIKQICTIKGLNKNSFQGDKIILDIVKQAGAQIEWQNDTLIVKPNKLIPIEIDLTHYPDLFPPAVVLCLAAQGTSVLYGVNRLFNKESNRAETLTNEFKKTGAEIYLQDNKMIIHGKGYLNGGTMHSHNDHRIVMAGAIANTIAKQPIIIEQPESVKKSFPNFFETIKQLGLK